METKVKAAFLDTVGSIIMTDVDPPRISAPDQLIIQVRAVGVCGSEVHAFEGTHPYRKAPVVLGHEMAGVILEKGASVTSFEAGDRVIVDPQWVCGECDDCRAGRINFCPTKKVLGTSAWPGAFAEKIVAPEKAVFKLPEQLSFVQGALVEPLSVAVHVAHRAGIGKGSSVAILGSGSIGSLAAGVSRALGAKAVISADVQAHCLAAAVEHMGVTSTIRLPDDTLVEQALEATGGAGLDAALITADDPSLVNHAFKMVRKGGEIILVALLTEAPLEFYGYELIGRELNLRGSIMSRHADVMEALELAASGTVDVESLVTHVLPIDAAQEAMLLSSKKADGAIKVVMQFDGE